MAVTQSIDTLFSYVQPEITSCPNTVVRSAILRAAIDFCERSLAWTDWQDMIPVSNTIRTWTIDVPLTTSRIVLIRNVFASNRELVPKTMSEISRLLPNWQTAGGQPDYYNQINSTDIQVFPIPANTVSGTSLTIRAAFAPTPTSTVLPNDLINLYFEPICARAKAILMAMPKQPWSDAQLASAYQSEFRTKCDEAKIQQMHDRTQGSIGVAPRLFGTIGAR